jgi:hypothetical protein
LKHARGSPVELALHEPRHQVHHRDVHAAQLEAVGCLQAKQAAADTTACLCTRAASIIASVSAMSR